MTEVAPADSGDELDRLRALVGPSEVGYESLSADRDAAQAAAKQAMTEAGALRGQLEEMRVHLSRARQDQDMLLRRAELAPFKQAVDRLGHRWATSVAPRVSRLLQRVRPS